DRTTLCAQRHAYADLVRAPFHAVGGDAVQADAREYESDGAEEPRERSDHILLGKSTADNFRIRLKAVNRDVETRQRVPDLRLQAGRISWRPDHDAIRVVRPDVSTIQAGFVKLRSLCLRDEVHRPHRSARIRRIPYV